MNIVIIEDEKITAEDLQATIKKMQPDSIIVAVLGSVQQGISFFSQMPKNIDLIFSDIQLGDGTSFDIFSQVTVPAPVIFCTAFDEYALDAFKANGIDYILKPFTDDTIRKALQKYLSLKERLAAPLLQIENLLSFLNNKKPEAHNAVLVHQKDKILPIPFTEIAFFFLKNGVSHLTTFSKKTYYLNKTLEELEKLAGAAFFRVNRQYIINRKAVVDASSFLPRKLSVMLNVPTEEVVLVSKEKASQFLEWLTVL